MTEEEIKLAEEAKKGKKEPPKRKGPEIEVEGNEKKEELTRRGSQSSRYDDESVFYQNKEDLFKHPCITWENDSNDTRPIKSYPVSIQIEEMKLLELLEFIEDDGAYLDFTRIPKNTEEEAKKKPIKGKQQEEAKLAYYKAWVDLSNFKQYGITEQLLRVKLEESEGEEISNSKTYLSMKLKFSTAIFPPPPSHITTPQDIIPAKPPPPKFLPSINGTHDFQRQIKLACKAIAAEFHNSYADQLSDNLSASIKQKELKDARRDEFLYNFNTSGKSQILKNKLRKSVVKICREKYKNFNTLKGLSFSEKDKVFSELYAYLLGKMQESIAELMQEKKEVLHEEPILPHVLAEQEKQERISEVLGESYDKKLRRLSLESELVGDVAKAAKYYNERTEKNPLDKEVWLDFARFSIRQGNLAACEKYVAEAISIAGEESSKEDYLLMACIYLTKKKYNEALVFFNNLLRKNENDVVIVMLISLTYKLLNKQNLEKLFLARGKRLCMKHFGCAGSKSTVVPSLQHANFRYEEGKGITPEVIDDLNFMVVEFLLSEKLAELSRISLERVANKDSGKLKFLYFTAEIEYWSKHYDKVIEALEELLKLEPRHNFGWTLKDDSYFNLKKFEEAQELKAIRYSKSENSSLMIKLGNIFLMNKGWVGAKLLFIKCCEQEPASIA